MTAVEMKVDQMLSGIRKESTTFVPARVRVGNQYRAGIEVNAILRDGRMTSAPERLIERRSIGGRLIAAMKFTAVRDTAATRRLVGNMPKEKRGHIVLV